MFVKPEQGRVVRDPVKGTLLPETGAEVPDNIFWRRRLRDGDVMEFPPNVTPVLIKSGVGKKSQEDDK